MSTRLVDQSGETRLVVDLDPVPTATGAAGGVLDGTYPNPGLAAGVAGAGLAETTNVLSVNVDGSTLEINADALRVKALGITDSQVAAANKDGAAGTASMRTLGSGAATACAGNDARLSDSRAPNGAAGGNLSGTYPNPAVTFAAGTVRTAAGVPAGAPTALELPFAYDSTAVTGGFYYWNGAAWVKIATIL